MIPLKSLTESTVLPPWPSTFCVSAGSETRQKLACWGTEDGPLPAETWKRNSPLLEQMSHRKDLPGKVFFEFSSCTGISKNTCYGLMDFKEEKAIFSGLGSEQGCKWLLPRDSITICSKHQFSVSVSEAREGARVQVLFVPVMHRMNVRHCVLPNLLIQRQGGGRCRVVSRRQGNPVR